MSAKEEEYGDDMEIYYPNGLESNLNTGSSTNNETDNGNWTRIDIPGTTINTPLDITHPKDVVQSEDSEPEGFGDDDHRFLPEQWRQLIEYWDSEEGQREIDIRTKKQPALAKKGAKEVNDLFSEVFGKEKHGHVRGLGLGPAPTHIWTDAPSPAACIRMATEARKKAEEETKEMKEKMIVMETQLAEMKAMMTAILQKKSTDVHQSNYTPNLLDGRQKKAAAFFEDRGVEASEEASDTATGTIAEVLMEIKAEHGHSDSAKQVVEIDDVHVPDQDPGVINVYFHIIDKLECCGVHKFSQPGIFLRTEVAMHVLNKMQEYGKNNPVTADFVKDERRFESWNSLWSHSGVQDAAQLLAKWFASYFEHILEIPVGAPDPTDVIVKPRSGPDPPCVSCREDLRGPDPLCVSCRDDPRGPDPEAQVRTLSAYHAYKDLRGPDPEAQVRTLSAYHAYKDLRGPDPEAQVRTLSAYHAYKDLRGPNPEAQVRTLSAYHAYKDLRGPDPEAQVRTLSAYHAERTYGVRILLRVRIPNLEKLRIFQFICLQPILSLLNTFSQV
uniref:Uncharacterized protein n=1 Tax=Ananas comosus var. bracteatus TaxID=296719 RepID=A0A6V7PSI4_ANACO|nr:unnamed protein product [Ananas comosus var. bracteatus]